MTRADLTTWLAETNGPTEFKVSTIVNPTALLGDLFDTIVDGFRIADVSVTYDRDKKLWLATLLCLPMPVETTN